ncbi:MAG: SPOR domain-containing protein [Holosporaceae bacterium]|nr:SPOR domain-containing protein [Holosporaceae bacterium]
MPPFLDDEDEFDNYLVDREPKAPPSREEPRRSVFFQEDRRFFILGGVASAVAFGAVAYIMYSNSKVVDVDELPVIAAETTPLKEKPTHNDEVDHQDKVVYDNISGEKSPVTAVKTTPQPEEVLSINEVDMESSLSDEEKKNIIEAFDELVPDKEYKINYIKNGKSKGGDRKKSGEHNSTDSEHKKDADRKKNSEYTNKGSEYGSGSEYGGGSERKKSSAAGFAAKSDRNDRYGDKKYHAVSNGLVAVEKNDVYSSQKNAAKNVAGSVSARNGAAAARSSYNRNIDTKVEGAEDDPPIKRLEPGYDDRSGSRKKSSLNELMTRSSMPDTSPPKLGGSIMVQIASLSNKSGAEVEYKRLCQRNRMLGTMNRKIVKVDLGRSKGIRYRVLVGPFKNTAEANKLIQSMQNHGVNAYISR